MDVHGYFKADVIDMKMHGDHIENAYLHAQKMAALVEDEDDYRQEFQDELYLIVEEVYHDRLNLCDIERLNDAA